MAKIVSVNVNQVTASASKGAARNHEVFIDRPPAQDGEDMGPMGGELLLLGLGGCFMSTLLAAIRAREADVSDVNIEVAGVIDGTPASFTAATLTIAAKYDDRALMEKLIAISERGCLVVNTLKDALDLSFEIVRRE